MTSAQVIQMSLNVTNSPCQVYTQPDDNKQPLLSGIPGGGALPYLA